VGPTAVPGLPAVDVVDLQVVVRPDAVEAVRSGLDAAGFPRLADNLPDGGPPPGEWWHGGADPGRPVRVALRPAGSPAARAALLWRDWLRADAAARAECGDRPTGSSLAFTRAEEWAASSGWTPSLDERAAPVDEQ
jgi:dephospho-CoA kinase